MQKFIYAIIITCLCLTTQHTNAQGTQTKFGKNRVQYHRDFDEWMQYESDNFITYWYGEGRNVGQFTVQMAEEDFEYIQTILEHRINERLQIIVYTDLTDLKQSNIGSEEAFTNTGGQTKIVGNKIFVSFNGSHYDLRREIREGIASVYLESMLFGSNIQEIVQNAVMMNLPDWFKEGLVSYIGESWNTELDNKLRDYILSEDFKDFEDLAEDDPQLAGHALWYFIGENFGTSTVSNLLYLTRINRSVESGFLYVLGSPYEMVLTSWTNYFKERYKGDDQRHDDPTRTQLKIKNKRKLPISELKVSPNGQQVVYATNEIGKYKVYLHDLGTGDRKVIHKGGFRNAFQETDYNYPLLAWSPSGTEFSILYERRDVIKLMTYDIFTKKKKTLDLAPEYQRVYSMDYINPISLVFSAGVRGFSDIFIYYTNTRQTQRITQDHWDDLDATFMRIDGRKAIVFASNRQDTLLATERLDSILPTNKFDLFYYDLEDREQELVRITNTPWADERQPVAIDSFHFAYLSDRNGIYNREKGYLEDYIHHYDRIITLTDGEEIIMDADSSMEKLDSAILAMVDTSIVVPIIKKRAITYPTSNYKRNVVEQNSSPRANRLVEMFYQNDQYEVFFGGMPSDSLTDLPPTVFRATRLRRSTGLSGRSRPAIPNRPLENVVPVQEDEVDPAKDPAVPITEPPLIAEPQRQDTPPDTAKIDVDNYLFQSEFDDEPQRKEKPVVTEQPAPVRETPPANPNPDLETIRVRPGQAAGRPVPTEVPTQSGQPVEEVFRFRPGRITPYRLQFRTDYVTTQMDNSLLFEGLDSYASNTDGYNYPPPGILLKANFKDLFEDHEFEGGVRIPTTFNGTEYFMTYSNKKKRLDKTFAVYRRNQRFTEESNTFVPNRRETNVLLGQFGVRYPLDIFRSLRATATLRRDRTMLLATDVQSLNAPVIREQRAGIKLEYVFDNTLDVSLNIKNGTRYKVFAEVVKKFSLDVTEGFKLDLAEGFMTVLGFDARHYQRLDRRSIIALRAAGASSFGSERNIYFLGAVDNWLFPMFNNDIPQPSSAAGIAYQTLASNLRGFDYNIRNGTTYLLANAELRVPIFQYLSKNIRSSFFRNFQVVGFFDVGSAWTGPSPYSDDNPLNTTVFAGGDNIQVKVTYFRDPIVAGYGAGVRSMLFGYFIRLDYAWGIETRQVQDPKLYISLGTDF
ncbi:hypothetical protein [Flavilitoribacter nigricans]|uniref:Translocation protein TolB n=1 Tax=Flavilitoribacter nigricans (strain ATCC 23147 / DSM 23189 / NBRC 102662 / NCIMB 1420 / SS-2) TaxID=1122177 RepID=A0A2D0NFI9_FLAN2|nr:hypothetical protein [Flavilitoribacter nigricans]PHN07255.1 hypothetical protein CRP01_06395 [Flavilitoribacter nigricans DSM 23189 = NBRC 102662]